MSSRISHIPRQNDAVRTGLERGLHRRIDVVRRRFLFLLTGGKEKKTTPDDVYAAVKATFEAVRTASFCRGISEMQLDNLRAAGRAVRETVSAHEGDPRERTPRLRDQTTLHQGHDRRRSGRGASAGDRVRL